MRGCQDYVQMASLDLFNFATCRFAPKLFANAVNFVSFRVYDFVRVSNGILTWIQKYAKNILVRTSKKRTSGHVRPAKILIRLRICAVWSESSKAILDSHGCSFLMRTTDPLIRLFGCTGWFDSSLGVHQKVRFLTLRLLCPIMVLVLVPYPTLKS